MLTSTNYTVNIDLIQSARDQTPESWRGRITINRPTGNFFYDPWVIKEEFQNTIWEILYNSLPANKGEARIIILDPAECYVVHADLDDRFHLNVSGEYCYMIDIDNQKMYPVSADGVWYDMDTSLRHTAANFGRLYRIQLVIRKLLPRVKLNSPISIRIVPTIKSVDHARYIFDDTISPWLNLASKNNLIDEFTFDNAVVSFKLESIALGDLQKIIPSEFDLVVL